MDDGNSRYVLLSIDFVAVFMLFVLTLFGRFEFKREESAGIVVSKNDDIFWLFVDGLLIVGVGGF